MNEDKNMPQKTREFIEMKDREDCDYDSDYCNV